jgi:hypothetical protein
MESGKYLHQLTTSSRWRELDIEREIFCQDIDEKLYIHGRLDMYDYKTQTIIDLKITNAIKWQHSGLPNQVTPAVAAGIDLKLRDNKLGDLITRSARTKDQAKKELELEPQLGKRIEYIDIKREADCISIKPKGWKVASIYIN